MLCHAATFAGYVVPFGNVIGPLVVWLLKKDTSAFVDEHGKEALNFQLSMTLYIVVVFAFMFVLIGFVALPILTVLDLSDHHCDRGSEPGQRIPLPVDDPLRVVTMPSPRLLRIHPSPRPAEACGALGKGTGVRAI